MDAAVHAAVYPTTVALTSLLTSPTWRHLAFNADDTQTGRFLHRVADTVNDGYYPTGGQDPLRAHLNSRGGALPIVLPTPHQRLRRPGSEPQVHRGDARCPP